MESFSPQGQEDEERLLDGARVSRVIFGHTHVQFTREGPDGVTLVNPGSVGIPLDGDRRAGYALIDEEGVLELRRVDYDHETAAAAIGKRFADATWTAIFARRILTARSSRRPRTRPALTGPRRGRGPAKCVGCYAASRSRASSGSFWSRSSARCSALRVSDTVRPSLRAACSTVCSPSPPVP